MKLVSRLRAVAARLRPLAQQASWREHLQRRAEINRKLEALLEKLKTDPPPPATAEDRARWARENDALRRRDPAKWRDREELHNKLRRMIGEPQVDLSIGPSKGKSE